jgi:crotonobetainyl-CoA:carnitine CoA-transferase CaiB-like acyl-CoA transferase
MKLGATPVRNALPPPMLGQHTEEVLRELLHCPEERLQALKKGKVI